MQYLILALGLIAAIAIWFSTRTMANRAQRQTATDSDGGIEPADAEILPLLGSLPDLLDAIQYGMAGDADKAALAKLALPPPEITAKLAQRVDAAIALHGIEPLRKIADELKTTSAGPTRTAKTNELLKLIGICAINDQADAIFDKIKNGEKPSPREIWFLEAAKKIWDDLQGK